MRSSPSGRQRLALDERRAQLLAHATRLFSERAYDEVSIDDIADAAQASKGLLYHYFGSKRGLYVATVRAAAEQLRDRIETDPSLPVLLRIHHGIDGYLGFVDEHALPFVALMRSGVGMDPEVSAVVDETRELIVSRVLEHVGGGAPAPVLRVALRGWVGFVEAASIEWLEHRDVTRETLLGVLLASLESVHEIAERTTRAQQSPPSPPREEPPPSTRRRRSR